MVYRIDRGLLELIRLLLDDEKGAAEELGHWGGKAGLPRIEEGPDLECLTDDELQRLQELCEKLEAAATT